MKTGAALAVRPHVGDGAYVGAVDSVEMQPHVVLLERALFAHQPPGIDELYDVTSVALVDRALYLVIQPSGSR